METFASVVKQFYEIQTRQALHEISIDEILQTLWAHTVALQRLEAKFLKKSTPSNAYASESPKLFKDWIFSELKEEPPESGSQGGLNEE